MRHLGGDWAAGEAGDGPAAVVTWLAGISAAATTALNRPAITTVGRARNGRAVATGLLFHRNRAGREHQIHVIGRFESGRRETREHQYAAYLLADRRQHLHFAARVLVRQAVLHVHHAHDPVAGNYRRGKEGLVVILFELAELLEARVAVGLARDGEQPPLARDPAGETFAPAHAQLANRGGVGLIGRAQDQVLAIQQIDEAGIAGGVFDDQGHDAVEHILQAQIPHHEPADLLKQAQLLLGAL